jgi:hypothetical protein
MTAADEGTDWSLVNFAKQVFGAKSAAPEVGFNFVEPPPAEEEPAAPVAETETAAMPEHDAAAKLEQTADVEDSTETTEPPVTATEPPVTATAEPHEVPPVEPVQVFNESKRQLRTPAEMADIIMNALRAVDGVPERGFIITVYGSRPWNAMLTIKPEAGRVKDVQLWRQRVQDIGARLRRDFDLIDDGAVD